MVVINRCGVETLQTDMMKEVKDTLTYVDISDNYLNSIENNAFNGKADKINTHI